MFRNARYTLNSSPVKLLKSPAQYNLKYIAPITTL